VKKKPAPRRVVIDVRELKPKQVPLSLSRDRDSLSRKLGIHFPKELRNLLKK
jgi:hypothetical protein